MKVSYRPFFNFRDRMNADQASDFLVFELVIIGRSCVVKCLWIKGI